MSEAARSKRPTLGPLGTRSAARFVHANQGPHPTPNRSKSRRIKPKTHKNPLNGWIANSGAKEQAQDMHAREAIGRYGRKGGGVKKWGGNQGSEVGRRRESACRSVEESRA